MAEYSDLVSTPTQNEVYEIKLKQLAGELYKSIIEDDRVSLLVEVLAIENCLAAEFVAAELIVKAQSGGSYYGVLCDELQDSLEEYIDGAYVYDAVEETFFKRGA